MYIDTCTIMYICSSILIYIYICYIILYQIIYLQIICPNDNAQKDVGYVCSGHYAPPWLLHSQPTIPWARTCLDLPVDVDCFTMFRHVSPSQWLPSLHQHNHLPLFVALAVKIGCRWHGADDSGRVPNILCHNFLAETTGAAHHWPTAVKSTWGPARPWIYRNLPCLAMVRSDEKPSIYI